MAAFNFPDSPFELQTVENPITGSKYQWRSELSKWVLVGTSTTDGILTDLDEVNQNIEDLNDDITRIDDKIAEEIENRTDLINAAQGRNNAQDAAIAELDARVDSISENIGVLEFKGVFTYKLPTGSALAEGTFTSDGTDISDATVLTITGRDKDGEILDWQNVLDIGDYLELAEPNTLDGGVTGGDTVLYEVTSAISESAGENTIPVQFIKETGNGDGLFDVDVDYTIRVFKKDLGIDINEADARYVIKPSKVLISDTAPITGAAEDGVLRNGELWFDTATLELFVWNTNAWVTACKPVSYN